VELTVEEMDQPRGDVAAALYFCCLEALQTGGGLVNMRDPA